MRITDPLKYIFNGWTAWHMLGGAVLARIFMMFVTSGYAVLLTLLVAILWEVLEWFVEGTTPYLSRRRYINDTIQDIAVAVIMACLVAF